MNTANKLTMMRIFLIPVFLIVLYLEFPFHMWIALAVFVLASVTDFIDGYVARNYNQITDFGKFMDPLADKVLVMAAMLWFVEAGRMPAWALLIVVVREFAVTAAGWSGKVKTASTMVCIVIMLALSLAALDWVCVAVILVTTVYSGIEYFVKNRDVINWSDISCWIFHRLFRPTSP